MNIVIDNKTYFDLYQLGKDICLKPMVFYNELLANDELKRFIKESDEKKYEQFILLDKDKYSLDEYLFYVAYLFNPYQNLKYHTYEFDDLLDLGRLIIKFAPKIDVYLKDLLTKSLLLYFIDLGDSKKKQPELYQKICEFTALSQKNANLAYFRLGIYLNGNEILYNGKKYNNYNDFVDYLLTKDNLKINAEELEKSQFLYAYQIESTKSLETYKKYRHLLKMFNDKKRRYDLEYKRNSELKKWKSHIRLDYHIIKLGENMSENIFDKVEKQTNVSKEDILKLAKKISGQDLSSEDNLRALIKDVAKLAGKEVSKEKEEKIISAVKKDKIPHSMSDLL